MTRDEARAKLNADRDGLWGAGYADRFLTALEELGLLRFDNPEIIDPVCALMRSEDLHCTAAGATAIIDTLLKAGFRITR